MHRTLESDPTAGDDRPYDDPGAVEQPTPTTVDAAPDAEPDQGWLLTAVLVGLMILLALCAALALIAWDRAPVGAAG